MNCAKLYIAMLAALWFAIHGAHAQDDDTERGAYLARISGCYECHINSVQDNDKRDGVAWAGGRAIATPFGNIYSSNISPDKTTGIGLWSEADFSQALHDGHSPTGQRFYPAFPYTSFTGLTDADVHALYVYLQAQAPVVQNNKSAELNVVLRSRTLLAIWQGLYFSPRVWAYRDDKPASWNRGAYLTQVVVHCGECHTPRDVLGGSVARRALAGATLASGNRAPNITPHHDALGLWSVEDLAEYLRTGRSDYTRKPKHEMREFIDNVTRYLTEQDRLAIAEYVLSQKPLPVRDSRRVHYRR